MSGEQIPSFEGSHVYILDSMENPRKIVLARNPYIGHVATPGFGKRGDMSFEDAAKQYTEKQTGLMIDDLELLSEWDNDGRPFKEPNGVVQFVKVRNYLARKVEPEDIGHRINEYRETVNGRKYMPEFVEISELPERDDVASDIVKGLKEHFNYEFRAPE